MAGNEVRVRAWVKDEVSGPLGKMRDKFDLLGKGAASSSLAGNVGAMALAKGVGIASMAVGQLGDAMGQAIQAAMEEERSIARLNTAIEANVQGWDGNTDAIERVLSARIKLGFADDEQRDSLASLVAVTQDATKALDLQRIAMDLARLRGIELATASDIIGKVYGGNIGILARYGIQLRAGISSTEALAEIQKRAAGQAEAFADTTSGKLLVAQTEVDEAMERFGGVTLPLVADGASAAADIVTGLADAFEVLNGKLPATSEEAGELETNLVDLFNTLGSIPFIGTGFERLSVAMEATKGDIEELDKPVSGIQQAFDDMGDEAKQTARITRRSFSGMVDDLISESQRLIDDFFDPIETRADIYQSRQEQHAAEEAFRDAKTAASKREAADDIIGSISDQADALVDLSQRGKLTSKDVDNFERNVKESYDVLGKEVPKDILKIIAKLRELDKWDGHVINVTTRYTTRHVGSPYEHRASGGPVKADEAYVVGESGRELFVPNRDGQIIPNSRMDGSGIGPLGLSSEPTVIFNFYGLTYPPSPAQQQEMARTLGPALRDYLNRRG